LCSCSLTVFDDRLLFLQDSAQQLELQACCAAALYPRGDAYAEAATQLVMSVLEDSRDVPAALLQYAVIAADRQLWGEVAKGAVLLLAVVPMDRQGQQLLAQAVQVRGTPFQTLIVVMLVCAAVSRLARLQARAA
jgi:hypothetical protein